jgi:hypothetical protein
MGMLAGDASSFALELGSGVGGCVVGGLTVWAAVALKFGVLMKASDVSEKRADRHEEQDDRRFEAMDRKLDRILDAVGGGRLMPRTGSDERVTP